MVSLGGCKQEFLHTGRGGPKHPVPRPSTLLRAPVICFGIETFLESHRGRFLRVLIPYEVEVLRCLDDEVLEGPLRTPDILPFVLQTGNLRPREWGGDQTVSLWQEPGLNLRASDPQTTVSSASPNLKSFTLKGWLGYMHPNVHCSTIYNNQDMEAT